MWDSIVQEEPSACSVSDEDVDTFAVEFNITLPVDYRVFLKKFGQGVFYNHSRIFGPPKITGEINMLRERWENAFLWDSDKSALTADDLANSVIIGDTFNGDEFVLSPAYSDTIFYLPQDSDKIVELGSSLELAVQRLVSDLQIQLLDDPDRDEWGLRSVVNYESF